MINIYTTCNNATHDRVDQIFPSLNLTYYTPADKSNGSMSSIVDNSFKVKLVLNWPKNDIEFITNTPKNEIWKDSSDRVMYCTRKKIR